MRKELNASLIALLSPLCWSTIPLIVYFERHIPALLLTSLCLFCFVIFEFFRQIISGSIYSLKSIPFYFHLNGILGIVGFHYFYFSALKMAPITPVFLIINLASVFIMLYGKLFLGNKITRQHVVGIVMAFLGVLLMSLSKMNLNGDDYANPFLGYFFAFLAANCWAIFSVVSSKFKEVKTEATIYVCLWSAIICFVLFLLGGSLGVIVTKYDLFAICYLGLFPIGYAFYFWNYGMRFGDINLISILSYLNPVIAAILLVFFDLEEFSTSLVGALFLVIFGSALACFKTGKLK